MKRFPPADRWPLWELWTRPEATGGRWTFKMFGTFSACLDAMGGRGLEYSMRHAAAGA